MCALSLSKVQYYLSKHPYATVDELRAYVEKQSKGKNVNPKEYDKVMRFLNEREAAAAAVATMDPANVSPKAQEAIDRLQKQQAGIRTNKEAPVTEPYVSAKKAKEMEYEQNLKYNAEKRAAVKEQKALKNEQIMLRDKAIEQAYKAEQLHSEVKLDAARSEFWQKEMEAAFGKENVNAATDAAKKGATGVPKERALAVRGKSKSPQQILKEAENELRQASQTENASRKIGFSDWKRELQVAVDKGEVKLVQPSKVLESVAEDVPYEEIKDAKVVDDVAKDGVDDFAKDGKEATKGLWTKIKNLAKRIGKKGWIGIAIASVVLISGIAIHKHNKNKAQNLNVSV